MVDTVAPDPAPPRSRLPCNAVGMLAARVVLAGASLVSVPVLYDRLGAQRFGIWMVLSGMLGALALVDLGLGSALVREVARAVGGESRGRLDAALGLGLAWGLGFGLCAVTAVTLCWPLLSRLLHLGGVAVEAWHGALWLCVGVLAAGVELPWRAVLEGSQRYGVVSLISAATALAGAGAAVLAVRLGGLGLLGAATAATAAARAGLTAAVARHQQPGWTPRPGRIRRNDLRLISGYGMQVQVSNACSIANTDLDWLIVGGAFGPATAGACAVGARLLNLLRLPPAMLLVALFPVAVAGNARHGCGWLDRFYAGTTGALAMFVAPGVAVLVVCADPLVRLWIGYPVPWAALTLAVLAPAHAFSLIAGPAAIVTRAEARPGRETRYALGSVALNLALTVPLLWLVGPLGVPLATSIAVLLATGYFFWYFHRATGRRIGLVLAATWRPLAASVAGGGAGWLARGYLPDGSGRAGAALALGAQAGVVLLVAAVLYALLSRVGGASGPGGSGAAGRFAPAAMLRGLRTGFAPEPAVGGGR